MIKLTIGTNTTKKVVLAEADKPVKDILSECAVDVTRSALHLNGTLIPGADTELSLEELGIKDGAEAMLIAVIKADSAR